MTAYELELIAMAKNRGDSLSRQLADTVKKQDEQIEALKLRELTEEEIKEVYDQYFDLENFGWLHLQCIREILQKAREK